MNSEINTVSRNKIIRSAFGRTDLKLTGKVPEFTITGLNWISFINPVISDPMFFVLLHALVYKVSFFIRVAFPPQSAYDLQSLSSIQQLTIYHLSCNFDVTNGEELTVHVYKRHGGDHIAFTTSLLNVKQKL